MNKVLRYIRFLESKVGLTEDYDRLFTALYDIPFTYGTHEAWSDTNRAADGIGLRRLYFFETGEKAPLSENGRFCTLIEMIVALSLRIETDIMGIPGKDDPCKWFRLMLENLGIAHMDNVHFNQEALEENVYTFLNHDYGPHGEGSLFPLNRYKGDQRLLSIWDQMNQYMIENWL